jgi:hypothetical protein
VSRSSSEDEDLTRRGDGNQGKPPSPHIGGTTKKRGHKVKRLKQAYEDEDNKDELELRELIPATRVPTPPSSSVQLPSVKDIWKMILYFFADLWVSVRYVTSDTQRNKRNFFIAVITIIIVVTSVVSLATAISKASLVFIKLAENSMGEYDLVMTPTGTRVEIDPPLDEAHAAQPLKTFLLNATDIQRRLAPVHSVTGAAPRWTMLARLGNRFAPERNASAIILAIDSEQEKQIGLGRSWPFPPLGEKQAYIPGPLLRNLKVKPGDWITLTFDLVDLASDIGGLSESDLDQMVRIFFKQGLRAALANRSFDLDLSNPEPFIKAIGTHFKKKMRNKKKNTRKKKNKINPKKQYFKK